MSSVTDILPETNFQFNQTLDDSDNRIAQSPLKTFVEVPSLDVRQACINEMEKWVKWGSVLAMGADVLFEKLIEALVRSCHSNCCSQDGKFAGQLFNIYLRLRKSNHLSEERAFQFGIALYNSDSPKKGFASKMVPPILLEFLQKYYFWNPVEPDSSVAIEKYSGLTGLRQLLAEQLNWIATHGDGVVSDRYNDTDWAKTCRVLRLVNIAGDFRFLPDVERLLKLLTQSKADSTAGTTVVSYVFDPKSTVDFYQQDQHVTVLHCVIDRLRTVRQKEPQRFEVLSERLCE